MKKRMGNLSLEHHLRSSLLGSSFKISSRWPRTRGRRVGILVRSDSNPNEKKGHNAHPVLDFGKWRLRLPNIGLGSKKGQFEVNSTTDPMTSHTRLPLVRLMTPLWKEGLLLIRCSVFAAVLGAAGMLVWYGQRRARSFVEAQLLPSVCSILSEHLQRDLLCGKVQSITPLGITLQSCSIGPHRAEFSCGEVPTMKLRIRPFASLRRGKVVVDAVLSRPNILVAQKEDFSWLGLPLSSNDGLKRHSPLEEGIDYRTKTRRLAREEAAAKWYKERFEAARSAAEAGYIVPEQEDVTLSSNDLKSTSFQPANPTKSVSYFCMDDRAHWKDDHRVDVGSEYVVKHAELEKSFGVSIPSDGVRLWPTALERKSKRNNQKKLSRETTMTSKRRNLERSAAAARAYFRDRDGAESKGDSTSMGCMLDGICTDAGKDNVMATNNEAVASNTALGYSIELSGIDGSEKSDNGKKVTMEMPHELEPEPELNASQKTSLVHNGTSCEKEEGYSESNNVPHSVQTVRNIKPSGVLSFLSYHPFVARQQIDKVRVPVKSSPVISGFEKESLSVYGKPKADTSNLKRMDVQPVLGKESEDFIEYGLSDPSKSLAEVSILSNTQRDIKQRYSEINMPPFLTYGLRFLDDLSEVLASYFACQVQKLKSYASARAEYVTSELTERLDPLLTEGIKKTLPITLDSVYFMEGTLMLLAFGDQEPREMDNVNGHVKFQNHYTRLHVQLSGNCREWKSDSKYHDGGQLSIDVFVDIIDQKWHANLKVANLYAPLFERILELPITWSKGRANGEVHICMSEGETFPNLHGQVDVHDLSFQILDAPSCFLDIAANLCFRGQRIFLHNASGRFGDVPLEASGDFGINPEEGEFHLMCQVPSVEVNSLMKTFKMKPLLFSLAGSVTAVFNCQGPLDAPIFVGSGIVSRKTPNLPANLTASPASEAVNKNKEAGAVAAFDHIPLSHVSANFTFNTDNCVADLYGLRASLVDGGEIRGAGNAWICPEGEVDDSAMDINLSGNLLFDKVIHHYSPGIELMPLSIGELHGETKLFGSLLKPRFDIKWAAPRAEDSFSDARGEIIIAHDFINIKSSSVAFDLYMKIKTSYLEGCWQIGHSRHPELVPLIVEGLDMDLKLRGFDISTLLFINRFDSLKPVHLKATGRIKFQGKVETSDLVLKEQKIETGAGMQQSQIVDDKEYKCLVGDISLSGIKLNQLILAPQLLGSLSMSKQKIKLDASGRPDENLSVNVFGPLWPNKELTNKTLFSVVLQKGQLKANIKYQPQSIANLEVRQLPLDELELASLRGTIQRAEMHLNFQKRRGHGVLSVLHPKFSGVLGEALDLAARWSGDVITVEKTILEQACSRYELQGEYVLPGSRDRFAYNAKNGLLKKALDGDLGSVISSMGRWRMRLEVPSAEAAEMLPLARLLSSSIDPSVHSRSKDLFMQNIQSIGFHAGSLHDLLEAIHKNHTASNDDSIIEEINLPGLAELRGHWHGSLDASGGGDGDTMVEFDFHGEDWEWGTYTTQKVLAVGAYGNNSGLRLDNVFLQKDNATLHADGTALGQTTNLHFAVLNFPVSLVPTVAQIIESSTTATLGPVWQFLAPIKGILHMEGDLRGSVAKPECDVQVRLLDGAIGGIDLGRAEVVASITPSSRFLFNANFVPIIQSGHVRIQGSVPITYIEDDKDSEGNELDGALGMSGWGKNFLNGQTNESEKKIMRERTEDGWDIQLAESLKGLNWNMLNEGEVRVNADIKDGGMMLLTAMSPYANWLHGYADINLQVRGTVEQPVVDGSASFHRASVSTPFLNSPLTNFSGNVYIKANKLCIVSMESRVSRRGKLAVKGSLPLKATESSSGDKIDLKCEVLEVRAKNIFSGQVDSQVQIVGSILQPNISGRIKLSHGEAYLPHDKGNGDAINRLASKRHGFPATGFGRSTSSGHISRLIGLKHTSPPARISQYSGKEVKVEKTSDQANSKPGLDVRLTDLRLFLGPELRIVYPLILNFAVRGGLELDGIAHPKLIRPKGSLTFENGDVNLVATQVRLKRDHINVAKFEPDLGLDPTLDLALVGSDWQFRIQGPASKWQDNLVVTTTRSVDQDALSPSEAAKVFEAQLAESLLERDGQLAFKKLATATLETLMPKIEGKGEFGQARWRLVYAPQIPSLLSVDPTVDPLKSLANNISFGTEVEVQLGKRLQASVVRQMKDSEMALQWTLVYKLTSRLRVLFQSSPATRLLFEYSATS